MTIEYPIFAAGLLGAAVALLVSVAPAFTAFAVGGVANVVNLIDGFHGLPSGTLMIMLLAFALVANRVGDVVLGFFVVNFPAGKLFLGDAGAYVCGYVVAVEVSDLRTGQVLLLLLGCVVVYLLFYRTTHVAGVRLSES